MKLNLVLAAIIFSVALISCAPPFIELSNNAGYSDDELNDTGNTDDYVLAYRAMQNVLVEEFGENYIEHNTYPGKQYRRMLVYSDMNSNFCTKTRMKIEAFVGRDEYNQITPVIYCWFQIENPTEGRNFRPTVTDVVFGTDYPQTRFINAARNENVEVYLLNKTFTKLRGTPSKFSGKGGVYIPVSKPTIVEVEPPTVVPEVPETQPASD